MKLSLECAGIVAISARTGVPEDAMGLRPEEHTFYSFSLSPLLSHAFLDP